uniref:BPTI/Kunitz inhibitor domain-containing protein n=1 Tax=Panagrolaimus sp. ES5 TaxID=591445 RepID=A0AC34FX78_9BILA
MCGNSNNFVSKTECEIACPVLDNPCLNGFPALDSYGEPQFCSTANQNDCPAGHYCHIGNTQATTLCCPSNEDPCSLPMSKGIGISVLNRWYFNSESKVCVSFVYTGRGGNSNNFISRQQCIQACPEYASPCPEGQPHIGLSGQITHCGATDPSICPTTYWCHVGATLESSVCCPNAGDPCDQEISKGVGTAQLLRFYYNQLTRTCNQFRYSGLILDNPCINGDPATGPNGLYIKCSSNSPNVCPSGTWCHIGGDVTEAVCCPGAENPCSLPFAVGDGIATLSRYYFDTNLRRCAKFTYSGKSGTQHLF